MRGAKDYRSVWSRSPFYKGLSEAETALDLNSFICGFRRLIHLHLSSVSTCSIVFEGTKCSVEAPALKQTVQSPSCTDRVSAAPPVARFGLQRASALSLSASSHPPDSDALGQGGRPREDSIRARGHSGCRSARG